MNAHRLAVSMRQGKETNTQQVLTRLGYVLCTTPGTLNICALLHACGSYIAPWVR